MTRKEALIKAIEALKAQPSQESDDAVQQLQPILDELFWKHWTPSSIIDVFEQYYNEHGKYPSASELNNTGSLPSHSLIRHHFGLSYYDFVEQKLSRTTDLISILGYGTKTKEEWTELFISEYERIKPSGSNRFDDYRDKKIMPCAYTICKAMCETTRWREVITQLGLPIYTSRGKPRCKRDLKVNLIWKEEMKLKELLKKREELRIKPDDPLYKYVM